MLCALAALAASMMLWKTYTHDFTPYLKWQDTLVALLGFIALLALANCVFAVRFLHAVHAGYRKGMCTLVREKALIVRDLSTENLTSILWMLSTALACFGGVVLGFLPEILLKWTLHLTSPVLAVLTTGLVLILSLVGLVVGGIAVSFIVIAGIGAISLCRKLGSAQSYALSSHIALRIDNAVLSIIYPGTLESLIDLNLLTTADQHVLVSLLHEHVSLQGGIVDETSSFAEEEYSPSVLGSLLSPQS